MVVKETKIQKESIERHKFCDVCGTEISIFLMCSVAKCEYCKKDLCEECIGHEEGTLGDYRTVYCKKCWQLGNPYRPKIEKLENEIEILYVRWKNDCNN